MIILSSGSSFSQINGIRHVIIFGIDALSYDGVNAAKAPNIDHVIRNGAYCLHNRVVMPTMSAPNWASILMGAGPEQHSITSNEWDPNEPPFPPSCTDWSGFFPSIFSIIKQQNPEAKTTAIYDWDKFNETIPAKSLDFRALTHSSAETIGLALNDFKKNKPALAFWYFVAVDDAGDTEGHGTQKYFDTITETDSLIGLTLKMLEETGLDKSTLILFVSDHGGIDVGHGGESLEEIQVPMFIYGPGITKGMEIKSNINNFDIASTAAWVLGLEQPEAWIGRPVKCVFNKNDSHLCKRERIIKRPMISPKGGLFCKETPEITLKSNTSGICKIYYTLDGTEPDEKSIVYSGPLKINKSCKLKAVAIGEKGEIKSIISSADFRIINRDLSENGINYKYYEGSFNCLPDFSKLVPIDSGVVSEISLDSVKHRSKQFAVKFEGFLKIEEEGEYRFSCSSDDGARLTIDSTFIMAHDFVHRLYTREGRIKLKKGMHKIMLEYFDAEDACNLFVQYSMAGKEKRILSPDMLFIRQ